MPHKYVDIEMSTGNAKWSLPGGSPSYEGVNKYVGPLYLLYISGLTSIGLPIVFCSMIDSLILGCLWHLVFVLNNILILDILAFCNLSPPRMFLPLDLLSEYRIQHGAIGPLYVTSSNSTWIFCRGVSGFATDCPCGVWCRGLTTCLLHVGPPFGNRRLNNSWAVGLT